MSDRPYTVVCTDKDPQWLHERTKYVTASQISTIMGTAPSWMSKYTTYSSLLEEKRSGKPSDMDPSRRMLWGTAAESGNIGIFAGITGAKVSSSNVMFASKQARVAATVDGFVFAPRKCKDFRAYVSNEGHAKRFAKDFSGRGFGVLEAKQSDGWKGQIESWEKGAPDYYWTQVQTQLFVTGLDYAVIFCRLGVADLRAHVIVPDTLWQEDMLKDVEAFWRDVG